MLHDILCFNYQSPCGGSEKTPYIQGILRHHTFDKSGNTYFNVEFNFEIILIMLLGIICGRIQFKRKTRMFGGRSILELFFGSPRMF